MSRMVFPMPVTAMSEHAVAIKEDAVIELRKVCTAYVCSASVELVEISMAQAPLQRPHPSKAF